MRSHQYQAGLAFLFLLTMDKQPSMLLLELMTRWNDHLPVLKLSESKYLADVKHLSAINDLIQKKGQEEGFTPAQLSAYLDLFNIKPKKP
jgi:hypothetical protein